MKIKKVEIEAFRAYKSKSDGTFDFTNSRDEVANFIAIYAPNGFGKSSFYDAVEWAITNRVKRLENYQNEAKSTKQRDEGLNILRNKYVDEKTVTTVVLSTNKNNVFKRDLPKIRKNQNDMSLGNKENDFFRHTILSQDEIEGFLREEKPQERYSKFMESFGGDTETARKELSALINDNKIEIIALNKKRKNLVAELEQPIDVSIFDSFNSVAEYLNSMGEAIEIPDKNISTEIVNKLDANLVSRRHELNTTLHASKKAVDMLSERLNKLPEIEIQAKYVEEKKTKLNWLLKGIINADKYQKLFNSYEKCVEDQKQANIRLKKLIELNESADDFFQIESRLKEITKAKNTLTEELSKQYAEITGFQENLAELKNQLKVDDDRTSLLRKSADNSEQIYNELSSNKILLDTLNKKIIDKKHTIQEDKARQESLNGILKVLSPLKISAPTLLSGDIGPLVFEKEKIEQLAKDHTELELLNIHNNTLQSTQRALTEQLELHERLVAIGLDYLSIKPSHVCPLCTATHPTPNVLIDKLKSQNLLSELSQENYKNISLYSKRQKELEGNIQEITQQAVQAQAKQLTEIREFLNNIEIKLAKSEQEEKTFSGECNSLENRNLDLEKLVWGLSKQELLTRVSAELNQLSLKRINLVQQQENMVLKIDLANESLKNKRVELSVLSSEIEANSNSSIYISVLNYINENSIPAHDFNKHCEIKINEFESIVKKHHALCESLDSQCNNLQLEMTQDGTWIDFSHLKNEKETLEQTLVSTQSEINVFYQNLSSLVRINPNDKSSNIKEAISNKIEELQSTANNIEKVVSSIKLLLDLLTSFRPYIKQISIKEELEALERKIESRDKVNNILEAERAIVTENLKSLINNFFYEDLINSIYKKIDPHPTFKKVEFKVSFETERPSLNILVSDGVGGMISPILYFSAAQTNILSLSVFLANALHAKDNVGNSIDVILIDDPIQAMDSINILSTIDLLRSICLQFNKQVIISTHDENFFGLLQRKIPTQIFGSKFLQLEKFGVVVPVEQILN